MNARTKTTALTIKIPISAAFLYGLAASACAVKSGSFTPNVTNHPANPEAEEGQIWDPGNSLAMSRDHSEAATEHSDSDGASKPLHARYACPMHPDVGSDQPGKCSRCGMALKERKSAAAEGHMLANLETQEVSHAY